MQKIVGIVLLAGFQLYSVRVALADAAEAPSLIFQSRFEPGVSVVDQESRRCDIVGTDNSLAHRNDWVHDLEQHENIGNFSINYEDGDESQRIARLVQDPFDNTNTVLEFWMKDPNIPARSKGRIQTNLYNNDGLREFSFSVKMLFSPEWAWIRDSDQEMRWFLCSEYWNNANWTDEDYRFRFNLHVGKATATSGNTLYFYVRGQVGDPSSLKWGDVLYLHENKDIAIPIDQWFTLHAWIREGNSQNGRIVYHIEHMDGSIQTLFDLRVPTHHPDDPAPDGFSHLNLLKAYGHASNIDHVRNKGGVLRLYWDDFMLWLGKRLPEDDHTFVPQSQASRTKTRHPAASEAHDISGSRCFSVSGRRLQSTSTVVPQLHFDKTRSRRIVINP